MIRHTGITLFDLVNSVSNAIDLVSTLVINHNKRVGYISVSIANEMGLDMLKQNDIMLAGLLHDAGAFSIKEKLNIMQFEFQCPDIHAEIGYKLFKKFEPLSKVADIIRYHHRDWNNNNDKENIPLESYILHLSDRIDILLNKNENPIMQIDKITEKIKEYSGTKFAPEIVDAFLRIAQKEYFWLDIVSNDLNNILSKMTVLSSISLDLNGVYEYSRILSQIIDFRSHFTATHSSGIAATSEALAALLNFSKNERMKMRIAGYLHDIGKLAIPNEILEKPDKLTKEEFNIIKSHTYYTYKVLDNVKGLETIRDWGAFHHERMDGKGYPFHINGDEMELGSRIMAVSDVFTAITEDRPYRKGMDKNTAVSVIKNMSGHALDKDISQILLDNFDEITQIRQTAQEPYQNWYDELIFDFLKE